MARYISIALLILVAGCVDTHRFLPTIAMQGPGGPNLGALDAVGGGDADHEVTVPTDDASGDAHIPEPDPGPPDEGTEPDVPEPDPGPPDEGATPDEGTEPDEGTTNPDTGCHECPAQGDQKCDGNDILLCNYVNGCLAWVLTETCDDGENVCATGQCKDGQCVFVDTTDGTPCQADGNACTFDICQAGVCQNLGRAPVEIPESVTAEALKATPDGKVYVVGSEEWAAGFDPSPWAGRIGAASFVWEDTFLYTDGSGVGWNAGAFHALDVTAEGGAVFAGDIQLSDSVDAFLYKATQDGEKVFDAIYGDATEGAVAVLVRANYFLLNIGEPWLRLGLDSQGTIKWMTLTGTSLPGMTSTTPGVVYGGPSESGGIRLLGATGQGYEDWSWEVEGVTFIEIGYGDGKMFVVGLDQATQTAWFAPLNIEFGVPMGGGLIEGIKGTTVAEVSPEGDLFLSETDGTVSTVVKVNHIGQVQWQSQALLGEFGGLASMPEGGLAALGSIDGILGTADGTQKVFFFDRDGVACGF